MRIIKLMDLLQEKAKLGSGSRFKAVEKNAAEHGASDPAAVAASVGFKKYGKEKMEKMAHAHENTEVVKEGGLTTVKKTNPGPSTSMTTYERDANGIRQTTGSKTVDKAEQRKKYDKYINPPNRVETKHTLMKNLIEYDLDDDAVENDNGPGQQLPESAESITSLEAHKLGLISSGYGRWVDPKNPGVTVAKTIQGQLVKIEPHNDNNSNDENNGPTDPTYLHNEIAQGLKATSDANSNEDVEEATRSLHSYASDIKSMSPKTKEFYVDALDELGIAIETEYDVGGGYTKRMPISQNKNYENAFSNFLDSYNNDTEQSLNGNPNANK